MAVPSMAKSMTTSKSMATSLNKPKNNDKSVVEWQKLCSDIVEKVEIEKEKNQNTINQINIRQKRFNEREKEFRSIIDEFQHQLK